MSEMCRYISEAVQTRPVCGPKPEDPEGEVLWGLPFSHAFG